MKKPVICDSNSQKPALPEFCEAGYWEVPVDSLSDIKEVNRDHAYILPDDSVWILNHEGNGMIQVNGGSSGSGQPTIIRNNDGYLKILGAGTYNLQIDLDQETLIDDLGLNELSRELKDHIKDSSAHVTEEKMSEWDNKQERLIAGTNITIENNVISADSGEPVSAGYTKDETDARINEAKTEIQEGKVAAADKLAAARNITLRGGVTGEAAFDGSENISIETTIAGNAPSATKLETGRTVSVSGAVSGAAIFDGTKNVNIDTAFNKMNLVNLFYPIGCIYQSTVSTNPGTLFGGTWERYSNGRVLVGVNESDSDFSFANRVGGAKTNDKFAISGTLYGGLNGGSSSGEYRGRVWTTRAGHLNNLDAAMNYDHSNLQPYTTVYMWQRVG